MLLVEVGVVRKGRREEGGKEREGMGEDVPV